MAAEDNPPLRIVGGHLTLDLVNTVAPRRPAVADRHEYLAEPADLLEWAQRIELIDVAEAAAVEAAWSAAPGSGQQALRATLEVREASYALLAHRLGVSEAALDPSVAVGNLNLHWAAASARSALVLDGATVRLDVGITPAQVIPDRLARIAVDFLTTADTSRLKECPVEEGGCGFLFLDHSRNGTRRWCAMADCGSTAKARRLTASRRARATGQTG
ncbi:CGNR zinc finger domain-containing protein [Kribbella lupini]|uniref:CGNR zinc finger domain-containing protein n=1 Tax=Kribbella lupini TaxID=291602 RepID=A0ABP4MAH8_9ACTN